MRLFHFLVSEDIIYRPLISTEQVLISTKFFFFNYHNKHWTLSDTMPNPNNDYEDESYGLLKTFKMQQIF